ncbi:MAG: hypothetical protein AB7I18_11335 [Candidatus Berkiella sp.]
MANSSQKTKQAPFSTYVQDFDELVKKLQFADSDSEVSQLLHEINTIMSDYFRAMMALCEEQHQRLFDLAEENRSNYSEKVRTAFDQAETAIAQYVQQARDMNQSYWENAKEPLKMNPQQFIQQTMNDIQKNMTAQMHSWQEMGESKSKEWVKEIENLQDQTSQLLKIAEQNHKELIEQYRELESRLKAALMKKNNNK